MKGNPFRKFGTGNLNTLKFDSIRNDLLKFYNSYYSANLMKLVVYSSHSLEELEKMAIEKFSDVPNHKFTRPVYKDHHFDKTNMCK